MTHRAGLFVSYSLLVAVACSADDSGTESIAGSSGSIGGTIAGSSGSRSSSSGSRSSSSGSISGCTDDQAYCEGNIGHHCSGNDKHTGEWETEPCAANEICIKGICLTEPLEPCDDNLADGCSRDGQKFGYCTYTGYYYWYEDCDASIGETCLPISAEISSLRGCAIPSMGACSSSDKSFCRDNRIYHCSSLYWRLGSVCNSARGETCTIGKDKQGYPRSGCIVESLGECSTELADICHGDVVLSCSYQGYWQVETDCAAMGGYVCRNGHCEP